MKKRNKHIGSSLEDFCQRIVEAQGGRLWAESKPGEGAAFFFTLPVEDQTPRKPISTERRRRTGCHQYGCGLLAASHGHTIVTPRAGRVD
jgi:hypothetical protein